MKLLFLGNFVELARPRLSLLVMFTVAIGWASAGPWREARWVGALVGLSLIALVVMGSAALNCYWERDLDALMERTRHRPLPSGKISPGQALGFGLVLLGLALPLLYLTAGPLTAGLAALAAAAYVLAYTPLKQRGPFALFVGAIPGALPPVLGRTLATGTLDFVAWKLFALLFVWQLPHFLAISLYHAGDYQRARLPVYGNTWPFERIAWVSLGLTLLLGVLSLWPTYSPSALLLNSLFTLLAASAFWAKTSPEKQRRWARAYFIGSLVYLPLALGLLLLEN